jgi:hypothetical protein
MITTFLLSLNLFIMKQLILFISFFIFGNSFRQTLTITNSTSYDICTNPLELCLTTSPITYCITGYGPTIVAPLTDYAKSVVIDIYSGGTVVFSSSPFGSNGFCPTGFSLSGSDPGTGVNFLWTVDLAGNVRIDYY